jgi:hypothetical protein
MIMTPDDYSWFSRERFPELADAYCFTYVRGLTPEELLTRLGVAVEDRARMTFDELRKTGFRMIGAVAVGDWVLMVEAYGLLGATEEIIMPLSADTRLVSHFFIEAKALYHFYWVEDGTIQFESWHEGESEEVPDELVETMERLHSGYPPPAALYEKLAFRLAEPLTGITLTPQLLEESTYLCVVPGPR